MLHKRIVSGVFILIFCAIFTCSFFANPAFAASFSDFDDIKTGKWYSESVDYVISKGLFQGISKTQFGPKNKMTRGMFVTVLGRMAGADADAWCKGNVNASDVNVRSGAGTGYSSYGTLSNGTAVTISGEQDGWYYIKSSSKTGYMLATYVTPKYHKFTDVSYGQYYSGYAIWAYERGYVSGTSSSSEFSPKQNITREQICTILYNYAQANDLPLEAVNDAVTFVDADSIHSWAVEAVNALQRAGVINGYEDNSFQPTKSATRAEVAAFLYAFIKVTGEATENSADDPQSDDEEPEEGGTTADAVTISDSTISVYDTIRVALYAASKSDLRTQIESVKLYNSSGTFDYGYMDDDRNFVYEGNIDASTIVLTTDGSLFTAKNSAGDTLVTRSDSIALHPTGTEPLTCINDGNYYYGDFNCLNASGFSGYITFVNYVDLDHYVKGVLPFEFGSQWPNETLKAGAIAIRSYAMRYISTSVYKPYGFDLDNSTRTQVYYGRKTYSSSYFTYSDAAVDATANMYLTYNGGVAYCMYSASNGGQTYELAGYDYLIAKTDPFDAEKGNAKNGHGIGLSQWGSYIMGKNYDYTYLDILGFYYPGTTICYGA